MYSNEVKRIDTLTQCLLEFEPQFKYQSDVRKLLSEGIFLVILMYEMELEFKSPMYQPSRTLLETKQSVDMAMAGYVKDCLLFLEAHKIK